jgi:mono/diheme cytochrome c family protein
MTSAQSYLSAQSTDNRDVRPRRAPAWLTAIASFFPILFGVGAARSEEPVSYSRDIRSILSTKCFTCHGPDAEAREAGLRLDTQEDAVRMLDSGSRAVVPGDPQASELLARVTTADESLQMPPPETGKTVSREEAELLRRWIAAGAVYATHWSFRGIEPVTPPQLPTLRWGRNDVDRFILAKLTEADFAPSPPADRATLLRRLHLDLTGIPPAPADVAEFVGDERPDAYERHVEKLLASPHFGERWARHWLDLARYADSNGYLGDELRPQAYRFRNWVINAINDDMPYDRFTIEQVAGDLLPAATVAQKIATGFHANAMVNTEAGVDREGDRVIQTVDRLSTVGTAWMGLTIACAECHTHKYDPISHREFYEMYAFFNSLEPDDLVLDVLPAPAETEEQQHEREQQAAELIGKLRQAIPQPLHGATDSVLDRFLDVLAQPEEMRAEADREDLEFWLNDLPAEARELARAYEEVALRKPRPTNVVAMSVREREQPRVTRIHHRGDYRQATEEVRPNTPAFLPPLRPRTSEPDRLDLARWLVRDDHPLTARTAVNHVWHHLFGRGLVDTADNFGTTGSEPTHPELLDWLALQFRESGWSRKALIRLIVSSETYRQSSMMTEHHRQRDPRNRLLARQSRWRLEAEVVRDAALAVSGLLNPKIGGPSIRPPLNSRITEVSRNGEWQVSSGAEKYRRGLYILHRRATPYPMLATFDAPDSTASCPVRERSNSPLQSLALLNDPVFWECAQHLGAKLARMQASDTREWLAAGIRETLSRQPVADEVERLERAYQEFTNVLKAVGDEHMQDLTGHLLSPLTPREQAARVLVARCLLNVEQFMTRE